MRTQIQNFLGRFRRDESGAAMVEYGIALLVVAAIGVTVFSTMGAQVAANASAACDVISGAANSAGC